MRTAYVTCSFRLENYREFFAAVQEVLKEAGIKYSAVDSAKQYCGEMKSSKEMIKKVDMLIAEVSIKSIAIGIEIGWADSFGKEIIYMVKENIEPSTATRIVKGKIISYKSLNDLENKLKETLKKNDSD